MSNIKPIPAKPFSKAAVGDWIAINGGYRWGGERRIPYLIEKVERTTATQVVTAKSRYRKADGYKIGGDRIYGAVVVDQAFVEQMAAIGRDIRAEHELRLLLKKPLPMGAAPAMLAAYKHYAKAAGRAAMAAYQEV